MAAFFRVCLFRLVLIIYVLSVGNIFLTSILSESPSSTAVLIQFTVRMSYVAAGVFSIPDFQLATSNQVKINICNRLLQFYCRRCCRRHAIVGHWKCQCYKEYNLASYLQGLFKVQELPDWGTYPSFEPQTHASTLCQAPLLKNSQGLWMTRTKASFFSQISSGP